MLLHRSGKVLLYAISMNAFDPKLLPDARRMIESGDFSAAIRLHRRYFPLENRPMLHETDEGDLAKCFSTPLPVFTFCKPWELLELRIRMAVELVEGRRFKFVPDDQLPWHYEMSPKAVFQNFYMSVAHYRNMSTWKKTGCVKTVRLLNSNDGPCPECGSMAIEYALENAPAIPVLTCHNLNTVGCRCILTPAKIKGIDC
jgi:hypothetical protein